MKLFKVGGAVRDQLLGIPSKDIDFACEAKSFNGMHKEILRMGGKIFLETPEFLTIRAFVPDLGAADFVMCRADGDYHDGRHPESVKPGTILDDLSRRDFTMNAIAIDKNGNILDPFGGQKDILSKIIKCVGDPQQRMQEDSLRAFRALRFSIKMNFVIHPDTAQAMRKITRWDAVSTERIWEELNKMFMADCWGAMELLRQFPNMLKVVKERKIQFLPKITPK